MDGINFPVCTEGAHSCLWFHVLGEGRTPLDMWTLAIQKVFVRHHVIASMFVLAKEVAAFL